MSYGISCVYRGHDASREKIATVTSLLMRVWEDNMDAEGATKIEPCMSNMVMQSGGGYSLG